MSAALTANLAIAAEPPDCANEGVLTHLRVTYKAKLEVSDTPRRLNSIMDVRETGYAKTPESVNRYAPANESFEMSRFCEANVYLDEGATDVAYFRLDGKRDEANDEHNLSTCFLSFDTFEDGCADQKPTS